jgi:hypothetical protein
MSATMATPSTSTVKGSTNYFCSTTITVKTTAGAAVASASVTVQWSANIDTAGFPTAPQVVTTSSKGTATVKSLVSFPRTAKGCRATVIAGSRASPAPSLVLGNAGVNVMRIWQ